MSILYVMQHEVHIARRLFPVGHTLGFPIVRPIYASVEIDCLLHLEKQDQDWKNRMAALAVDLDRVLDGTLIHAALSDPDRPYANKNKALLRQLSPGTNEVWEIRSRTMKPTIRIFGRFAAKDSFIALTWATRPELKGPESVHWQSAIADCASKWDELFHAHQPLTGGNLNDYVSNAISI